MQRRLPLEHQHRKQRRQSIDCALHRKQLRPQSSSTSVRIAIPMLGRLQKLGFAVERRIPRVRGVDGLGDVTDEIRRKGVGLPFARSVTSAAARDGGNYAVPVGRHSAEIDCATVVNATGETYEVVNTCLAETTAYVMERDRKQPPHYVRRSTFVRHRQAQWSHLACDGIADPLDDLHEDDQMITIATKHAGFVPVIAVLDGHVAVPPRRWCRPSPE